MLRITANLVVTFVQDEQQWIANFAMYYFIDNAMCQNSFAA